MRGVLRSRRLCRFLKRRRRDCVRTVSEPMINATIGHQTRSEKVRGPVDSYGPEWSYVNPRDRLTCKRSLVRVQVRPPNILSDTQALFARSVQDGPILLLRLWGILWGLALRIRPCRSIFDRRDCCLLRLRSDVAVARQHRARYVPSEAHNRLLRHFGPLRQPRDKRVSEVMPAVTHFGCFAGVFPSLLPFTDRHVQLDAVQVRRSVFAEHAD